MNQARTYDDPGDCIKCGENADDGNILRWIEAARRMADGVSVGSLVTTCWNCGYEWIVTAKDRM